MQEIKRAEKARALGKWWTGSVWCGWRTDR